MPENISPCHPTDLVVVEDGVSEGVLPWNRVGPQLLHEKHLIGQRGNDPCKTGREDGEDKVTETELTAKCLNAAECEELRCSRR